MSFKSTFQTLPTQFLELSNDLSEPFVIPDVSPVSSPTLKATPVSPSIDSSLSVPVDEVSGRERSMSIIELN
ncbi:sporulation protein 24 [[Candida] anglica]|uniref:Sporulation protein 24 n=1 Tax=[Candida] anglica TaxID=148631 RepID=A0ABP0ENL6_9ASCO